MTEERMAEQWAPESPATVTTAAAGAGGASTTVETTSLPDGRTLRLFTHRAVASAATTTTDVTEPGRAG